MGSATTPLRAAVELPEEGRLYQHWKGGLYRIVCTSLFEESKPQSEWMVTYYSLKFRKNWTRRLRVFQEQVTWPDGQMRARFVLHSTLPKALQTT